MTALRDSSLRVRARRQLARGAREAITRPWHVALGALVAGLLLAPVARGAVLGAAALLLALGLFARRPSLGLIAAATLLAGGMASAARLDRLDHSALTIS